MRTELRRDTSGGEGFGVCANEGCGKPAEDRFCDACGLEWSLFHRDSRGDLRNSEAASPPDSLLES